MEWTYGVLAVAPGVFLLWYFYRRDKWEKEPPLLVLATFFGGAFGMGALLLLAKVGVAIGLGPLIVGSPINTIVSAPLMEEPLKLLAVLLIAYPRRAFNEPMDGIVYGTAAALGFASVENILYVLNALDESRAQATRVLIARALLSVLGHALEAVPWGLALGLAKFMGDRYAGRRKVVAGLGMCFHAAHNALAIANHWISAILLIVLAACLWYYADWRIKTALAQSPFAPGHTGTNTGLAPRK